MARAGALSECLRPAQADRGNWRNENGRHTLGLHVPLGLGRLIFKSEDRLQSLNTKQLRHLGQDQVYPTDGKGRALSTVIGVIFGYHRLKVFCRTTGLLIPRKA